MKLETTNVEVEPFTYNEALGYINKYFAKIKRPEIKINHFYNLVNRLQIKSVTHNNKKKLIAYNDVVFIANHCIDSRVEKYRNNGRKKILL